MPRELIAVTAQTATIRGTVWRAALGHTLLWPRQVNCRMTSRCGSTRVRCPLSTGCVTLARLKATSRHSSKFVERTRRDVTRAAFSLGMAMGVRQALAKPRERRLFLTGRGHVARVVGSGCVWASLSSLVLKRPVWAVKLSTFCISRFRSQHFVPMSLSRLRCRAARRAHRPRAQTAPRAPRGALVTALAAHAHVHADHAGHGAGAATAAAVVSGTGAPPHKTRAAASLVRMHPVKLPKKARRRRTGRRHRRTLGRRWRAT